MNKGWKDGREKWDIYEGGNKAVDEEMKMNVVVKWKS